VKKCALDFCGNGSEIHRIDTAVLGIAGISIVVSLIAS
jgi:hypothetical protein